LKGLVKNVPLVFSQFSVSETLHFISNHSFVQSDLVFVKNMDNKYQGAVKLENLLRSDKKIGIDQLVKPSLVCEVNFDSEKLCNLAGKNFQSFVAIVNAKNEFMGVIPPAFIISTLMNEHTKDIHALAGIQKKDKIKKSIRDTGPVRYTFQRLPWLIIGLTFSFMAACIVSAFEKTLTNHITLAFFIPAIVYLADAVGTQTETVLIRNLSITEKAFRKTLKKEIISGFLISFILAAMSFLFCIAMKFTLDDSTIVSLSIGIAGVTAVIIGMMLPVLLSKTGNDPAYGSGPLATIIQDVISIYIYLLIANWIYS
jgi:magnesium transporter